MNDEFVWEPVREECKEGDQHRCPERLQCLNADDSNALFGHAVTMVTKFEDRWYAENGEYATVVRFCPFCGGRLHGEAAE